jgi:beta-N-acetylhexosaminidase
VGTVLLRTVLGFEGAAFSDDLEMGALSAFGSIPERCARAAVAGCDLLFVCRRLEEYPAAVAAVESGVPAERRAEAAERLEGYAGHLAGLRRAAGREAPVPLEALAAEIRSFGESLA